MTNADGGAGAAEPALRDYAIVVGVQSYPRLKRPDGTAANLQGARRDAGKVRDWLLENGVQERDLEFVVGPDPPSGPASPSRDAIVEAFANMWARCWRPSGAPIVPLGRRLYVYMSGHGLAADLDHGALLAANSMDSLKSTVTPIRSIRDFRQAGFFQQFVIWFDGCMDWTGMESEAINFDPRPGNDVNAPGPLFCAYAARPRLRTVEAPGADGQMGGVFTRALLEGLAGDAARTPGENVDGDILRNFLFNTMPKYIPAAAAADIHVDSQPKVFVDPGIVFKLGGAVSILPVEFRFGAQYDGASAEVWGTPKAGGGGLVMLGRMPIVNGAVSFPLQNGIYIVAVPQHALRTGFEVAGGVATKIDSA